MISMFWAKYPEEVRRMVGVRIMARRNTNLKNLEDLGRPLYRDNATRRAVPKRTKQPGSGVVEPQPPLWFQLQLDQHWPRG